LLFPIGTLPKEALEGFATSEPATRPIADRGRFKVGFAPLLTRVTLPATFPPACAANVMLKLALCPAASVSGRLSPLRLKPAPEIEACEIVMLDPPVLLIFPVNVWLDPTRTLPKSKLTGVAVSCPAATPFPESDIVSVGFDALLASVTFPVAAPVATGVKVRFNVVLSPGATVRGKLGRLRLKVAPVTVACDIVTLEPPVLVTCVEPGWLPPSGTVPNIKVEELELN
jgi:hypothetical protein